MINFHNKYIICDSQTCSLRIEQVAQRNDRVGFCFNDPSEYEHLRIE